MKRSSLIIRLSLLLPLITGAASAQWPTYGGDPGGQRFTREAQITKANLSKLKQAWVFHTGALRRNRDGTANSSFEATPILFGNALFFDSPFDEVYALNPSTGEKLWEYDPKIVSVGHGVLTSRGVAAWPAIAASNSLSSQQARCSTRIFVATMDARLIALDAASGKICSDFGKGGEVNLSAGMDVHPDEEFFFSSPPTVVGDVVIVGAGIGDNQRVDAASGAVRGFDAHTGKLVWSWDPIPWAQFQKLRTGAANAWSVMSADPEHNLIFVPTGAPSPDFYGGARPGDNRDANSVVALEATTGRRVWGFQVVHHDLWDYDVASEPVLFTWRGKVPAIAITTKMGLLFVLNRLTGEPLFPVEERPVPPSDVPGETAFPTQPFQQIASLSPLTLPLGKMLSDSPANSDACKKLIVGLRYDGMYTPPSLRGSVAYPGNTGGVNWGGAAIDPTTGILYANTNNDAFSIRFVRRQPASFWQKILKQTQRPKLRAILIFSATLLVIACCSLALRRRFRPGPAELALALAVMVALVVSTRHTLAIQNAPSVEHFGKEYGEQAGTPYTVVREQLLAPDHHLCTPLPWGTVSAVNLNTGEAIWNTPLGAYESGKPTGTLNLGGDILTASGLLFTGASRQPLLRAFDSKSGAELWSGPLPAPAQSTPMSYAVNGRQFVVIAAGGHGLFGTALSDALVAYALQ